MKTKNLSKKDLRKKADEFNNLIDGIVNETIDIPNDSLIMDYDVLTEIITKKRMELMQYISKFKPKSVQELANLTKRKKQAVDRDLKILERYEIIVLEKKGRTAAPKLKRKVIIMGLTGPYSLDKIEKEQLIVA